MQLSLEESGSDCLVTVGEERLDAAVAIQFKEGVRTLVPASADRVVLDLSPVAFLDSSGLGALVAVMKLIGPTRRLELAGLQPTVERVFRLTRMDTVFTIHASGAEALAAVRLGDAG